MRSSNALVWYDDHEIFGEAVSSSSKNIFRTHTASPQKRICP
jgi:hypothetical protein